MNTSPPNSPLFDVVDPGFGPDDLFTPSASPVPVAAPEPAAPIAPYTSPALDKEAQHDLKVFERRMGGMLPKGGWIAEYIRAVLPLTAAPAEFHLAAAISTIAATLGNRLFIHSWGEDVHPNLWIVLIAQSGWMNKSTSINLAKRMLRDAGLDLTLPSEGSHEAILDKLVTKPAGLWVHDEYGAFLSSISKDYNKGMKEVLTALYGGQESYSRSTKKDGTIEINRPALNMFGATTMDWLEDKVDDADRRGGFLARTLFVGASLDDLATDRNFTRMDQNQRNRLIFGLHRMSRIGKSQLPGADDVSLEANLSPEAKVMAETWFKAFQARIIASETGMALTGSAKRLQVMALKLAMIFRASDAAFDSSLDPLEVGTDSMITAIAYCELAWKNVLRIFQDEFADTKSAKMMRKMLEWIGKGGAKRTILKKSGESLFDFDRNLATLIAREDIVVVMKTAAELGLTRQRVKPTEWIELGPEHPKTLAKIAKLAAMPLTKAEVDWERAMAAEPTVRARKNKPSPEDPSTVPDEDRPDDYVPQEAYEDQGDE